MFDYERTWVLPTKEGARIGIQPTMMMMMMVVVVVVMVMVLLLLVVAMIMILMLLILLMLVDLLCTTFRISSECLGSAAFAVGASCRHCRL